MATTSKAQTGQAVARRQETNPVKEKRDALKAELAGFLPSYRQLLPPGYSAERLVTGALVAVTRNPDLLKCTSLSVATALAQVAQWGLDIGTTAHLVPYGDSCTPIADYKGYIELMVHAGAKKVEARVVRRGDAFDFQYGTEPFLKHYPKSADGEVTHAYAIIWLPGGMTQFEIMTVAEIEVIRQERSHSWKKGPLPKWYARKTVVRQLVKYVPKRTARLQALSQTDEVPLEEVDANLLQRLEPGRKPGERRPADQVPIRESSYDDEPPQGEALELTSEEEEEEARREAAEIVAQEGRR